MKKIIQAVAAGILLTGCTLHSVSAERPQEDNLYTEEEISVLVQNALTSNQYIELDLSAGDDIRKEGIQFTDNGNSYIFWQENGITRLSAYTGDTVYACFILEPQVFSESLSKSETNEKSANTAEKIEELKEWYLLQEGTTMGDTVYRFMNHMTVDETNHTASVKIRINNMPSNMLGNDGITEAGEWIATYNGPDFVNASYSDIKLSSSEEDGNNYVDAECVCNGMPAVVRIDRDNHTVSSITVNPTESSCTTLHFSNTPGLDITSEESLISMFGNDDVLMLDGGDEEFLSHLLYEFLDLIRQVDIRKTDSL